MSAALVREACCGLGAQGEEHRVRTRTRKCIDGPFEMDKLGLGAESPHYRENERDQRTYVQLPVLTRQNVESSFSVNSTSHLSLIKLRSLDPDPGFEQLSLGLGHDVDSCSSQRIS